jgi:hypothetical protein
MKTGWHVFFCYEWQTPYQSADHSRLVRFKKYFAVSNLPIYQNIIGPPHPLPTKDWTPQILCYRALASQNLGAKMQLMKCLILVLSALFVGCSTVTISDKTMSKTTRQPDWEESKPFYLGGLIGETEVDVTEQCKGKTPKQIQTQNTFKDGLLTVVTLLIYTPRSIKIWCE